MVFKFQLKYILLLSSVVFLLQCTKTEDTDNKVIARVGEKTLTQNEIAQIIPKNIEIEDSALMANDYVRKWVKQELLIKKANENLTLEQKI